MNQGQRIALILAAVVVLVGGFLLARGGGDDKSSSTSVAATTTTSATAPATAGTTATTTTTTAEAAPVEPTPAVIVSGGKPSGGIKTLEFDKGDEVKFIVRSDVADEIHVHGYDLMKDVTAGGTVSFAFKAKIDGIFEVELENAGVQIAELKVNP